MTLRVYPPTVASAAIVGDTVRITNPVGCNLNGLIGTGYIVKHAYGTLRETPTGEKILVMHESMPADIRALQHVNLSPDTLVERVQADNAGEISILGLQYLMTLGDLLRNRASSAQAIAPMLKAVLEGARENLAAKLGAAGMTVVEQVETKRIVIRRFHITSTPDDLIAQQAPHNAVSFDLPIEETETTEHLRHGVDRIDALLFANQAPQQAPLAPMAPPAWLAGLIGIDNDEAITGTDLGMDAGGDEDLSDRPAP